MTIRAASHAGSWYTSNGAVLADELSEWLGMVDSGLATQAGARVIIAPYVD